MQSRIYHRHSPERRALAVNKFRRYKERVSQQHRVRAKRKRRKAYLKRKKAAMKLMERESPKARGRKQLAPAE